VRPWTARGKPDTKPNPEVRDLWRKSSWNVDIAARYTRLVTSYLVRRLSPSKYKRPFERGTSASSSRSDARNVGARARFRKKFFICKVRRSICAVPALSSAASISRFRIQLTNLNERSAKHGGEGGVSYGKFSIPFILQLADLCGDEGEGMKQQRSDLSRSYTFPAQTRLTRFGIFFFVQINPSRKINEGGRVLVFHLACAALKF